MAGQVAQSQDTREAPFWRSVQAAAIVVHLALAGGYAFLIPPAGGPDESAHIQYVESLAVNHQLPALPHGPLSTDPHRIITHQAQHPPAYYVLLTPIYWVFGGHLVALYHAARLLSVLMGLGAILLTRRAAQLVFPGQRSVVALIVVFASTFGTFAYVCGTINNEPLAALVVSLGLYLAARAVVAERPLVPMALLGAAVGLGLLVKLTASVGLAIVLVAAISLASRREGALRRAVEAARLLAVSLACAAAVSGWWFVRNAAVHGTPMVRAHHRPLAEAWTDLLLYPDILAYLVLGDIHGVMRSIWGPRWLLHADVSYFHAVLLRALGVPTEGAWHPADLLPLVVLGAAAVGLVLARRARPDRPALDWRQNCLLLAAVGTIVWLIAGLEYQTLFVDGTSTIFGGRYTPVILPSLGVLLGLGIERLIPARFRRVAVVLILTAAVGYNLYVMGAIHAIQS